MVILFVLTVVLLLVAFPTTALGRALRGLLVDLPARRLDSVTPGKLAFYVALGMAGGVLFWLFQAEGLRLFSFMAPDLLIWFTVFDVSLYLDVLILGLTLSATARTRAMATAVVQRVRRMRSWVTARVSGRERAARPRPAPSGASSDDPDPAIWLLAA